MAPSQSEADVAASVETWIELQVGLIEETIDGASTAAHLSGYRYAGVQFVTLDFHGANGTFYPITMALAGFNELLRPDAHVVDAVAALHLAGLLAGRLGLKCSVGV